MPKQIKPLFNCLKATHLKTGKIYTVLSMDVIDCTNINDGRHMVLYRDEEHLFIREYNEFITKFTPILVPDNKSKEEICD